MRLLYSLLWYALLPLLFARLWWRGRRAPAYRRRWRERLALGLGRGRLRGSVWIHAVSVGETLAAAPLIEALLAARAEARKQRDFGRADAIRDGFKAAGVEVKDTAGGAEWSLSPGYDAARLAELARVVGA